MSDKSPVLGGVVSLGACKITGLLFGDSCGTRMARGYGVDRVETGSLVKIRGRSSTLFGTISRMWEDRGQRSNGGFDRFVEIDVLGEIPDVSAGAPIRAFERGVSTMPTLGAEILAASADDVSRLYALPGIATVPIGTLHQDSGQAACVAVDSMLGKHFAVLGTTGSGKSCAVAFLLHAILDDCPNGHAVLLDPHNEYAHAFGERAVVLRPDSLSLPYWLLNFEEAVATFASEDVSTREHEAAALKEAILDARLAYAKAKGKRTDFLRDRPAAATDINFVTVDTPVPYYLSDVLGWLDRSMGRLEKPAGALPYLRLKARIEALRADARFAFMFGDDLVDDVLVDLLSRLLRVPTGGQPLTIVDLSGVPSEIVDVVVSMTCRLIFDFALWSERSQAVPILVVCEEAHRYVSRDGDHGFAPTRRAISRIALEGRKYGVSLGLISHRPSELSATILSQCNTLFAMRMSNQKDQDVVRSALPEGAASLVDALPTLRTQEAIAVGEGVPVPMRLRFGTLDEHRLPRSGTAMFRTAWQTDQAGQQVVARTVDRWRRQRRC